MLLVSSAILADKMTSETRREKAYIKLGRTPYRRWINLDIRLRTV